MSNNKHVIVPQVAVDLENQQNQQNQQYQQYQYNQHSQTTEYDQESCSPTNCLPESCSPTNCSPTICFDSIYARLYSYLTDEINNDKVVLYNWLIVGFLLVSVVIITTITLSFHYVSYDQYALKRNKYHGVHLGTVYNQGRYFLTLDNDFVYFPSTYQPIKFTSKTFSDNGLEFDLDVSFYYKLPKEEIGSIYNLYSTNYGSRIENNAKQVTKNVASNFNVDQFLQNRTHIEQTIGQELEKQIKNISNIDAPSQYFKIINIKFPTMLIDKSLDTAIALQNNEIAIKQQNVNIIKADTNQMVSKINAEKDLTYAYAQTEANKIIANANSASVNMMLVARSNGLDSLCNKLNITSSHDINRINKVFAIIDNANNVTLFNTMTNVIING